jgi:hypothetical protein
VVSLGIFSEPTDGNMCPGVDSASKNEYQETPGGEGGRPVRKGGDLTSFIVPEVKKIRSLNLPELQGPPRPVVGHLDLYLFKLHCVSC